MSQISELYIQASLAFAAYADLNSDMPATNYELALRRADMSASQAAVLPLSGAWWINFETPLASL